MGHQRALSGADELPQVEDEPLFYYKDDPSRDARSVRGCFLDEIYAKPRLEQRLADT